MHDKNLSPEAENKVLTLYSQNKRVKCILSNEISSRYLTTQECIGLIH